MQSYLSAAMGEEAIVPLGRSGIWMRAIALTRNQNSVPAEPMMSSSSTKAQRLFTPISASELKTSVSASSVCMPSTPQ